MYRKRNSRNFKLVALTVSLFLLLAAGCGEEQAEQSTGSGTVSVEIAEQPPVMGWLDVVLPSEPVAMDGYGSDLWILSAEGYVMKWDGTTGEWAAVETDIPVNSDPAFAVSATGDGAALLTSVSLIVFRGDQVVEVSLPQGKEPLGISHLGQEIAVLFSDGSVSTSGEEGNDLIQIVESAGRTVSGNGSFCNGENTLAWMNEDGILSRFDVTESLLTETSLPENAGSICMSDGDIYADDGSSVYMLSSTDGWLECNLGLITGEGLLYTERGITTLHGQEPITAGLAGIPEKICQLDNGTFWSLSNGGMVVWAEMGSVETRLPSADVQMLRFRMAGQTGGGSSNGSGIGTSDASFGGVFRIYESVSSRPDPFSEFPLASRDLRRAIEDLTIEELHLVGITLDPLGGDQAMVEDANGVAYVLKEGTLLLNNTHIAEITGNEVIIVQEVTVGQENSPGGTTMIPTIFSMRLHEEGGL
ncbi:MAG: hypothetical protein KAH54_11040 [Candidatus Sabulitectum sp.]|nr:hypothetical protein [Candidatus Sabulitectum sp.]